MSAPRVLDLSSRVRSAETPKDLSRWFGKREILYDLYICQGKTLEDVKSSMETDHGFPKTLKLCHYESVLRDDFKFRKKLSTDQWGLSIGPQIAERKAKGKRSEVLLYGSKVKNVDRKISRSLKKTQARRRATANTAALPDGVVIRTPSPQPSTIPADHTFRINRTANDIEEHETYQSAVECLADSLFSADADWSSILTSVMPPSDAGPGATVLSIQLSRGGSLFTKFLAKLNEYQRGHNPRDLRLFGPNATIEILGKMCFDFSNGLQERTISRHEMGSIVHWIGSKADSASLKTFFAQKSLTILAVWEALNSTVLEWNDLDASGVLCSVYLSIKDEAPWIKTASLRYYDFSSCVESPSLVEALMDTYPFDQLELDTALKYAVDEWNMCGEAPVEFLQKLIRAGASLKNEHCRIKVDKVIRCLEGSERKENDLALLELVLKAGAVVDELSTDDHLGWVGPDQPYLATDYLLLNGGHSTYSRGLWSLVSSYSDRQQTTVTVPGIFEATQGGQDQLRFYLDSRLKPSGDHARQQVLELALSEASGRGLIDVVQSLVQFGVDPNVRTLPQYKHCGCTIIYGSRLDTRKIWHPVIRALNTGDQDAVPILLAVPSIDIALLDEGVGEQLDLCALRAVEDSEREDILQVLSTLNLSIASRSEILLRALVDPHRHWQCGHDGPDFGFVSQLLEFGLACLDSPEHLDGETAHNLVCAKFAHILVRAIKRGCGIRVLSYLIKGDVKVLSTLSAVTVGELLGATLERRSAYECQEILEFLAQNVQGFKSLIRKHGSSFLLRFLRNRSCHSSSSHHVMPHWQKDCEAMVTVKWFLGLGAHVTDLALANLVQHADDIFMLAMIPRVADVDAVNNCGALEWFIRLGRLNLAVALIERGVEVNGPQIRTTAILQQACENGASLWFIKFLVGKGADINAPSVSYQGCTALQAACKSGAHLSCIRFLIEKGADVNAPPNQEYGLTALQYAARDGLMQVAVLLLDYGADVNAISGFGFNFVRAIDLAAQESRLDMVDFLIAAGARSCQPSHTGFQGAIEIATLEGHSAVASLLQEHAESESLSGGAMEAERKWLRANPHACMCDGRVRDARWLDFVKSGGKDDLRAFKKYLKGKLN